MVLNPLTRSAWIFIKGNRVLSLSVTIIIERFQDIPKLRLGHIFLFLLFIYFFLYAHVFIIFFLPKLK
jgi:hypothetical protein